MLRADVQDKKRTRVCVVRHSYFPSDHRVRKEAYALAEAGFDVDVICLRDGREPRRETLHGINVCRLPLGHKRRGLVQHCAEYAIGFLLMFFWLSVRCVRRRYDVIQVNTMPDFLVFASLTGKLLGAKVLLDLHEPCPELFAAQYGPDKHRVMHRLLASIEQAAIRYADSVVTVNEAMRKRFIDRGSAPSKITVLRNVPDRGFAEAASRQQVRGGFTLLNHGLLTHWAGQDVILRALAILRPQIRDVRLVLAGDGENIDRLRCLAAEIHCADIVEFTGWLPYGEMADLIFGADVGIVSHLPGPFSELCQPIKLFEYVACRRPVIAPRMAAMEECFDSSCITLFKPGEPQDLARCILELYGCPDTGRRRAERAYDRFQQLRWETAKTAYVDIVGNLAPKRSLEVSSLSTG